MAKKKKAARKKAAVTARKKVAKTTGAGTKKKIARRGPAAKKQAGGAAAKAPARRISLGRPKATADEKLYILFKDDYHARQIFEFLRVETVRELEAYSPEQIVDRLSAPIVVTVQRIRRQLAALNRSLASDQAFAAEHKQSASRSP